MANQCLTKKESGKRIAFWVFIVLTLLWAWVIFGFSANTAEESTIQSNAVTEIILRIFYDDFDELSFEEQQNLIDRCDKVTRKLAHFTAYAILGFLLYGTLNFAPGSVFEKKYKKSLFSFVPCALFAMTDEYHQTLVEGRAGRFTDVLIDSSGVVFGIIAAIICFAIIDVIIKKKEKTGGV